MRSNEIDHVTITVYDCNGNCQAQDFKGKAIAYGKSLEWLERLTYG